MAGEKKQQNNRIGVIIISGTPAVWGGGGWVTEPFDSCVLSTLPITLRASHQDRVGSSIFGKRTPNLHRLGSRRQQRAAERIRDPGEERPCDDEARTAMDGEGGAVPPPSPWKRERERRGGAAPLSHPTCGLMPHGSSQPTVAMAAACHVICVSP